MPYWREIHFNNIFTVNIPCRCNTGYLGDILLDGWNVNDKKLMQGMQEGKLGIFKVQREFFFRIWTKWTEYVKPIRSDLEEGKGEISWKLTRLVLFFLHWMTSFSLLSLCPCSNTKSMQKITTK